MVYMLNSSTCLILSTVFDTHVTTHLELRDKGEHRERARGMMTYFMQNLRENKSETVR